MHDPHGSSNIAGALDRASLQQERRLARKLRRRRRSWMATAIEIGVVAVAAGAIWLVGSLDRNPGASALRGKGEQSAPLAQITPQATQIALASVAPAPVEPTVASTAPQVNKRAEVADVAPSAPNEAMASQPSLRLGREEPEQGSAAEEPEIARSKAAAVAPTAPQIRAPTTAEVDTYLRRARELVQLGDVAAARLLFARAAEGKDSRALVALAQTYDPVVLRRWRVVGMQPDPDRARALYQQALEQGSKTASEHLLAMK
jgi:TPR repeat protein